MVMVMIMINSIIIILTNIIINIINVIVMMIKNLSASPSLAARSCSSHFAAAASTLRKKQYNYYNYYSKLKCIAYEQYNQKH